MINDAVRNRVRSVPLADGLLFAAAALAGLLLLLFGSGYDLFLGQTVLIYAIAALGLDWLTGRAGQVSIGNAALLAVGAYTTAIVSTQSWGAFPIPLILSAIIGAAVGLVTGLPSLRLTGIHLALATLALQFIVVFAANRMESATGNIAGFPVHSLEIGGVALDSSRTFVILLLVVLGICTLVLRNLYNHLPGRMWRAIKEDELAASTMGIDTIRWKLAAFVGSSALVSVAGCFYAYHILSVSSATFTLDVALAFVAMLVIGGLGSISGVIFGAVFVTIVPNLTSALLSAFPSSGVENWLAERSSTISSGLYGLILLVFLVLRDDGVAGLVGQAYSATTRMIDRSRGRTAVPDPSAEVAEESVPVLVKDTPDTGNTAEPVDGNTDGPPPLMVIRDLVCEYQNGAKALVGLSLDVPRGQITAVVGRNGAGKSTLMRSITGFLPAERVRVSGSIRLDGQELVRRGPARTAAMGVILVPEREKIFFDLTVEEHFRAVGSPGGLDAVESDAFDVLRSRRKSRGGYLSGGERQLLALGMAACLEPTLLLIDEMSLGLAPSMIQTVIRAVQDLVSQHRATILVVEQNLSVVEQLTDRICVMSDGTIAPPRSAATAATVNARYEGDH